MPEAGGNQSCVVFAKVVHASSDGDGAWNLGCQFVSELSEDEFHRLLYAPPDSASVSQHELASGQPAPVVPSRLVPDSAPPESANQRTHLRHPSLESNVLRLAIRPAFGGRPALLVDVSAGGVGFLLDRPLEVEDVLAIELHDPDGGNAPKLAEVRHCRPCRIPANAPWLPHVAPVAKFCRWFFGMATPESEGRAWMVGCRFTRPLSDEELAGLLELRRRGHRDTVRVERP